MKVKVITYGCSLNQADSKIMESVLKKRGHSIVNNNSDWVIVNTCIVKSPTERKIIKKLEELKGKNVIVAGCMTQGLPELVRKNFPEFHMLGVENLDSVADIVEGKISNDTSKKVSDKSKFGSVNKNNAISILEISKGCLGSCSYCITKKARGSVFSYPLKNIVMNVEKSNPEVWLTAQDTGCYGFDNNLNLSVLIKEICKINKKFLLRIGMMNPNHAKQILPELLGAFESEKVFKFLHLPVQSGSDDVLKSMKRGYSVNDFEFIVSFFRKRFPQITISTDIITGYPSESDEDFNKTIELIEKIRPDVVNISMYWEREGTPAAEMKQLPNRIRKNRSRAMTKLCYRISEENNKKWIGWKGEVFVDENGKNGTVISRNFAYKPIILENAEVGKFARIEIVDAKMHYLIGRVLN